MTSDIRARVFTRSLNVIFRVGSLFARFALTIYLAKYLDLQSVGVFGLINGVIGVGPALLGFGINFYLGREIIGLPIAEIGSKLRDRLCVSVLVSLLAITAVMFLIDSGLIPGPRHLFQLSIVVFLEILAADIHVNIVALRMPLLANAIGFFRTAAWVAPFIGVSLVFPSLRNMGVMLGFWIAGLLASFLLLIWSLRGWPWVEILRRPYDFVWFTRHLRRAGIIYLSDLAIAVFYYVDRFFVGALLGLALTGVFTFYMAVANGVQQLVLAAVIQIATPKLVISYRECGAKNWYSKLIRELVLAVVLSAGLSVFFYVSVSQLIPYLGRPMLAQNYLLFLLLLTAMVVRSASDVANMGLYSRNLDRAFAGINIVGIVLSLVAIWIAVSAAGLFGAGLSVLTTSVVLLALRVWRLGKLREQDDRKTTLG